MIPSFAKSGGAKDRRGAKAREEMGKKGYLQTCELAQKLSRELGRKVTVCSLRSHHSRGRIQGVLHKESNIWFFPADTKLPEKRYNKLPDKKVKEPKQEQVRDEPVVLEVPGVNWPAPGFVKMAMMGLKRNYQVSGGHSLGWFGASA